MPVHLSIFVFTTLMILIVPGPDFVLVTRNTIAGSRARGYLTAIGICASLVLLTLLTATGVAAAVASNDTMLLLLRLAGGAYLVFLAVQLLRSAWRRRDAGPVDLTSTGRQGSPLLQGFLNNILNPKALVFYLTFMPQFVDPRQPMFQQTLLLGLLVVCCAALWWGVYITAIGSLNLMLRKQSVQTGLDIGAGIALATLGVLVFSGQL